MTDVAVADSPQLLAGAFTTVPGDRRSEVGHNRAEPEPQALSFLDQLLYPDPLLGDRPARPGHRGPQPERHLGGARLIASRSSSAV